MLVASLTNLRPSASFTEALEQLWQHPQVRSELIEVLEYLKPRINHLHVPLSVSADIPLYVHARYTRLEILAAFGRGSGARPDTWQTGVLWDETSKSDLFAFTLDKSGGGFSPTTRYEDYAISPELIHWQSQSATAANSRTARRYIQHRANNTNIVLFARLAADDRAFWCLGPATYVEHEGDRPVSFKWRLENRLPGDLYAQFGAAVA
jgi:hypothetical protein